MEIHVDHLQLSPRKLLRPGLRFRVRRGSGPVHRTTGQPCGVAAGEFRCLRLFRDSRRPARLYCDALEQSSGRVHTLYLAGPRHKAATTPEVECRPYSIALVATAAASSGPALSRSR